MNPTQISLDKADGVLLITLDRPDRLNAYTDRMHRELIEAFDLADDDDDVRAVIVTGRGRGFCAGADLAKGGSTFDHKSERGDDGRDTGGKVTLRIFDLRKPIIAAINGPAVGVGVSMTLAMDVRLASTAAKFGFVFARRGIVPDACASWFLPRVVGIGQALEWTMTGRVFDADEALRGGLVRSLHAPEDLLPTAFALAREIADNTSAVSVAVTRQLLWRMLGADHPMEAHKLDSPLIRALGAGADANEGVVSFLEKRPPRFTLSAARDLPGIVPWWEDRPFA